MKARNFLMVFILLMSGLTTVYAGDDKPVTVKQLPEKAQEFLNNYFSDMKISFAKMDNELFDKSYEVFFLNGGKIEFNGRGEWKEIKCKYDRIPTGAIPEQIVKFIRENHPENYVVEIDRDRRNYELKLNNGLEVKFDHKFNFIHYDY